jgi:hypothetical protein
MSLSWSEQLEVIDVLAQQHRYEVHDGLIPAAGEMVKYAFLGDIVWRATRRWGGVFTRFALVVRFAHWPVGRWPRLSRPPAEATGRSMEDSWSSNGPARRRAISSSTTPRSQSGRPIAGEASCGPPTVNGAASAVAAGPQASPTPAAIDGGPSMPCGSAPTGTIAVLMPARSYRGMPSPDPVSLPPAMIVAAAALRLIGSVPVDQRPRRPLMEHRE